MTSRPVSSRRTTGELSLRVAVQMDPMEKINIAGDSTFAIMLARRAAAMSSGIIKPRTSATGTAGCDARAHPVTVQRVAGNHFARRAVALDLGQDVDVVLMRQDPPFDLGYITATHLLERIQHKTLVVNDPAAVRDAPEKLFVLDFARFMPPTLITRRPKRSEPSMPNIAKSSSNRSTAMPAKQCSTSAEAAPISRR